MTQIRLLYNCALRLQLWLLLLSLLLFCVLNSCNGASTITATTPKITQTQVNKDPKCFLPLEAGPCRMSLERYYYNSQTNSCEKFKFGGCRGNDNRFGFRKTCEDACLRPSMFGSVTAAAASSTSSTTAKAVIEIPTLRAVAATTQTPKKVLIKSN